MKINFTSCSFSAKFLDTRDIQKLNTRRKEPVYTTSQCNIVEIDPLNIDDIDAIRDANDRWGLRNEFGCCISDNADFFYRYPEALEKKNTRFFAVTEQKDKFERLHPSRIRALAELDNLEGLMDDNGNILTNAKEIKFLQVDPEHNGVEADKWGNTRKKKGFGKALVGYIIDTINFNTLYVESALAAIPFYTALGFKLFDKDRDAYIIKKALKK